MFSRFAKRTITNIVAILDGKEEPDRWVMLGNHVDAWGKVNPTQLMSHTSSVHGVIAYCIYACELDATSKKI